MSAVTSLAQRVEDLKNEVIDLSDDIGGLADAGLLTEDLAAALLDGVRDMLHNAHTLRYVAKGGR